MTDLQKRIGEAPAPDEAGSDKNAGALNRRELFRLFGAGLLMFVVLPDADAQESGRGRFRGDNTPQDIGAWLHIDEKGTVSVMTGKVEVGQNARTSLSQSVAEELHVPVASIQVIMGDTLLTPYDMGTFGSRTTPTMVPQLRRAAAACREMILDLAAEQWKADRAALTAMDGKALHTPTGRSLTYGELLKGQKLTQTIRPDTALTPSDRWKTMGTSVPKVDGRAFVTGRHRFTSDMKREGMLFGKILRPVSFHATLRSLDSAEAKAIPGVIVVAEGDFVGIAAPTPHDAGRALAALKAEWQPAGSVSDHNLYEILRPAAKGASDALSDGPADHRLKTTYTVAYIQHAPLEPRVALAEWNDDKLTVWTGTQRPFGVRGDLAAALKIPESSVRVIVPDTGAGYGGKHTGEVAIEAARLARAAGKPVKLTWTREEEFTWAYFRPAGVIEVNAAMTNDGVLTDWQLDNYNSGPSGIQSPYRASGRANFHRADGPLREGSYRGLAATANHFARESAMDELAHKIGMDPLAFRLKNLKDDRLRAVLEAAAQRFGWQKRQKTAGHGFGIACGTEKGSYVATCAEIAVDRATGKVSLKRIAAAFECGAIVNPKHLENQVEGSIVMGLGGALFEAIHFDAGRITNPHFAAYRVPRFADVPPIETVLLDRKDLPSAGAGETPIVAIAPALAGAIFDAVGQRLRAMPLVPTGLLV